MDEATVIRRIRDAFEISIFEAKKVARMAREEPRYAGDHALAAAALDAAALAINVKGGPEARDGWNHRRALSTVQRFREMERALAEGLEPTAPMGSQP